MSFNSLPSRESPLHESEFVVYYPDAYVEKSKYHPPHILYFPNSPTNRTRLDQEMEIKVHLSRLQEEFGQLRNIVFNFIANAEGKFNNMCTEQKEEFDRKYQDQNKEYNDLRKQLGNFEDAMQDIQDSMKNIQDSLKLPKEE